MKIDDSRIYEEIALSPKQCCVHYVFKNPNCVIFMKTFRTVFPVHDDLKPK